MHRTGEHTGETNRHQEGQPCARPETHEGEVPRALRRGQDHLLWLFNDHRPVEVWHWSIASHECLTR